MRLRTTETRTDDWSNQTPVDPTDLVTTDSRSTTSRERVTLTPPAACPAWKRSESASRTRTRSISSRSDRLACSPSCPARSTVTSRRVTPVPFTEMPARATSETTTSLTTQSSAYTFTAPIRDHGVAYLRTPMPWTCDPFPRLT